MSTLVCIRFNFVAVEQKQPARYYARILAPFQSAGGKGFENVAGYMFFGVFVTARVIIFFVRIAWKACLSLFSTGELGWIKCGIS